MNMDIDEIQSLVPALAEQIEYNALSGNEYILCNAAHKHYLKINAETYRLLQLIDGKTTISEIAVAYREKYGMELSAQDIYIILYQRLAVYGVIAEFNDNIKEYKKPSYLLLSFTIINERILNKIIKPFYFLFRPRIAAAILLTLIPFMTFAFCYKLNLHQTFAVRDYFMYYILLMWISVTFHEIGHAAATGYYGARPGAIGGGFYLFRPVYFADVTDIWRLKKTQRIVVNISGIYFELIFNSIILAIGLIMNNYAIIALVMTSVISSLYNLNPMIRSDGFWIVSDMLDKPNLLLHAKKKIKDIFLWLFLKRPITWKISDVVLIFYGIFSYLCMAFFVYYAIIKNPLSVIYLPKNIITFVMDIVNGGEFSIQKLFGLIIPIMFYMLLFNFIKMAYAKWIKKNESTK